MKIAAAFAFVFLALPHAAFGQAYQCRRLDRPLAVPRVAPDGPVRKMPVAGYTLALSWSPEYCRNARASIQCNGQIGRFGLVVHGLWPEGRAGSWPQWCSTTKPVPEPAVRRHLCMTPSPSLIARQWAKHGSCMTREPEVYLRIADILWRSLKLPDLDRLSITDGLTAQDVRRAMVRANPSIGAEGVSVIVGRGGWLREIRLCYGKNFMPARCDEGRRGAPDGARVRIWRGL